VANNVTYHVFDEEESNRDVVNDVHGKDGLLIFRLMTRLLFRLEFRERSEDEGHRRNDHHAQGGECHGLQEQQPPSIVS